MALLRSEKRRRNSRESCASLEHASRSGRSNEATDNINSNPVLEPVMKDKFSIVNELGDTHNTRTGSIKKF